MCLETTPKINKRASDCKTSPAALVANELATPSAGEVTSKDTEGAQTKKA